VCSADDDGDREHGSSVIIAIISRLTPTSEYVEPAASPASIVHTPARVSR
jgi:hypothetical protein